MRQGEILEGIWENVVQEPPIAPPEVPDYHVRAVERARIIVISPDCDLLWDFEVRFVDEAARRDFVQSPEVVGHAKEVSHTLLLEVVERDAIRPRIAPGREMWRRMENNENGRYHRLAEAVIGENGQQNVPELFMDFKRTFALPTSGLY